MSWKYFDSPVLKKNAMNPKPMSWKGKLSPAQHHPGSFFFILQPHDFFSTLLQAHTKAHTNTRMVTGSERAVLLSARVSLPQQSDTPLFGIWALVTLLVVPSETFLLLTHSPRAIKPKINHSTKQGPHWQKWSALGKSRRCHQFTFDRDVTGTVARSQSCRGVRGGPAPAIL